MKHTILAAIRNARLPDASRPSLEGLGTPSADPQAQFATALQAVAGEARDVAGRADLAAAVAARYPAAQTVFSCVADVPGRNFTVAADGDPHAFDQVDLAVVPAVFGVAENGAVWITSADVPHRAALFLAQHLAVVLPRHDIVHHMHDAYARVVQAPLTDFGVFIAGPSKTADIEQCLVIGAHGARSLTVFRVGP
ncbi:MAG: LUD domain-containing protein [Lentisphaerae bacterium]|nr:LUD domain-containing protein [Lentisphaerota bacterium]